MTPRVVVFAKKIGSDIWSLLRPHISTSTARRLSYPFTRPDLFHDTLGLIVVCTERSEWHIEAKFIWGPQSLSLAQYTNVGVLRRPPHSPAHHTAGLASIGRTRPFRKAI